jgi:hypothetical protein
MGPRSQEATGQITLRLSLELHAELIEASLAENVSLNQFICTELARAIGRRESERATASAYHENESSPQVDPDDDPRWNAWIR